MPLWPDVPVAATTIGSAAPEAVRRASAHVFQFLVDVQLPGRWTDPEHCGRGHPWGPGRVLITW